MKLKDNQFSIHWFRKDLRLNDNPSLNYLSKKKKNIVGIFIYDDVNCSRELGSASKVWLYNSLKNLNLKLENRLILLKGDPLVIFDNILNKYNIDEICWNRCYEPWVITRDTKIKAKLKNKTKINSFNSSLLWEPWEILKQDGTPYKIFTPFYKRGCLNYKPPRKPESSKVNFCEHNIKSMDLKDLIFTEKKDWEKNILLNWKTSEFEATRIKDQFFLKGIKDYSEGRNFPNRKNVSRLSPYLHWGQISPNVLWYEVEEKVEEVSKDNIEIFKSELGWREFFYNLMYHYPSIREENLQPKFNIFPWEHNDFFLKSWQQGMTGYPIIDAGMRELWHTGYMHNRVRMITGSFLVKNLLLHWHHGEKWFWDCLFDADYASNSASWQWVAGTGTDSAPYFRIFNPITQSKKFDPEGEYIKKFVPELKTMPLKYLFEPWNCPETILKDSGIIMGQTYPNPIVDVKQSREKALSAFAKLKRVNVR